jgi:hypothetical protein
MKPKPVDWNVVVAGYWNPAILTPAGIARRLFGLPKGTPIQVEVPMDQLAPYRVKYDGITVTAEMGRLSVLTDSPEYNTLERAMAVAAKAIRDLPETPFSAAGFNLRFNVEDAPNDLLSSIAPPLDGLLSDAGFTIESRSVKRALTFRAGMLNLDILCQKNSEVRVEFNFHRQSTELSQLTEWLSTSIEEVKTTVARILRDVVHLDPAENEE